MIKPAPYHRVKRQMSVALDDSVRRRMKLIATERGEGVADLIRRAIDVEITKHAALLAAGAPSPKRGAE